MRPVKLGVRQYLSRTTHFRVGDEFNFVRRLYLGSVQEASRGQLCGQPSDVSEMFYYVSRAVLKQSHEQMNPTLSAFFFFSCCTCAKRSDVALIPDHLMSLHIRELLLVLALM